MPPDVEHPSAVPAATDDRTRAALDFVHGLLQAPASDRPAWPVLLDGLRLAFAAAGAGFRLPLEGRALAVYRVREDGAPSAEDDPWDTQPDVLTSARPPPTPP